MRITKDILGIEPQILLPAKRSCGKIRYNDKKAAITQRNKITRGHHCPECKGWHLTKRL